MISMTYVVGSMDDFNRWRAANRISLDTLHSVRHIYDEQSTLGLLGPNTNHRVVALPSANREAIRRLQKRGFHCGKPLLVKPHV